jgi:lysophospholipase L1-like esterase
MTRIVQGARRRRGLIIGAVLVLCVSVVCAGASWASVTHGDQESARAATAPTPAWVTSWAASPMAPSAQSSQSQLGFSNQTIRDIVYPSVGGGEVRVRFSNEFGTAPLIIGGASIAEQLDAGATVPGTMQQLMFAGKDSVTVAPGTEMLSDPLAYELPAEEDVALSVYLPHLTQPITSHVGAEQGNWLSSPGNFATSDSASDFPVAAQSWFVMDGLIVQPSPHVEGTVVALGDSITEGDVSQSGANQRWPNLLGDRLARLTGSTLSVVDEGIGGNRLLTDTPCSGQSGINRFQRDALGQPGVKDVIVALGTNDIINNSNATPATCYPTFAPVTAAQMIAGFETLAGMAHAAGVRIFAATIPPFHGWPSWTPAEEQTRQQVNAWILNNQVLDGGLNVAYAVSDPPNRAYLDPKYTSDPSRVHPNDAGYQAMADSISLNALLG